MSCVSCVSCVSLRVCARVCDDRHASFLGHLRRTCKFARGLLNGPQILRFSPRTVYHLKSFHLPQCLANAAFVPSPSSSQPQPTHPFPHPHAHTRVLTPSHTRPHTLTHAPDRVSSLGETKLVQKKSPRPVPPDARSVPPYISDRSGRPHPILPRLDDKSARRPPAAPLTASSSRCTGPRVATGYFCPIRLLAPMAYRLGALATLPQPSRPDRWLTSSLLSFPAPSVVVSFFGPGLRCRSPLWGAKPETNAQNRPKN